MIDPFYTWFGLFFVLMGGFLAILYTSKNRKLQMVYFISGNFIGFYFDIISFVNGYYSYPLFFPFTFLGIPLSMTLAEGFSFVITIKIAEVIRKRIGFVNSIFADK